MKIEKNRINLQFVGVYWSNGNLLRSGRKIKPAAVRKLLLKINSGLSERELAQIIYNDQSLNPSFVPDSKLIAEAAKTQAKLTRAEAREKKAENERRKKAKIKKIFENAKPEDFNILNYMRMPMTHCIAAIRSKHDCLSESKAKMLVGRWIREGV